MKTLKVLLAVLTFGLFVGLTACDDWENPLDEQVGTNFTADMVVPNVTLEASPIVDATMQTDMEIQPDFNRHREPPPPFMLNKILRRLNLSEEQIALVREYMQAHKDCVEEILTALRESEREIMQSAREERQAIMLQLQNGEITREEANALIRQLNQATREALQNNPVRLEAEAALEDCREAFFASIREILTEDQQLLWDEWVENFSEFVGRHRP